MLEPSSKSPPASHSHASRAGDDLSRQTALARQILTAEAAAINAIEVDQAFHEAVELIFTRTGHRKPGSVVVTGLGKSGLIGQKLCATFASTGTPSHFLHPTEAMHGDLGRIRQMDVVLALSYGGQTEEMINLATLLRQDAVPLIALVGRPSNDLARLATVALCIGDVTEACPMNLAPTASTTAMLALGDALALCVMTKRNFAAQDFHRFHPGGSLGKQLMPIAQAMRFKAGENLPLISMKSSVKDAYSINQSKADLGRKAGALVIVHDDQTLAGIFTDGDLRRSFIKHGSAAWDMRIDTLMTTHPRHLSGHALVRDAVALVRELRIDEIPIVDERRKVIGLIDVQDLVALKVIES